MCTESRTWTHLQHNRREKVDFSICWLIFHCSVAISLFIEVYTESLLNLGMAKISAVTQLITVSVMVDPNI